MLDVIEKKIKTAENHISGGAIDQLDKNIAKKLKSDLQAYSKIQNFSEEQIKLYENRIEQIGKAVEEYENSKSSAVEIPNKKMYFTFSSDKLEKVKANARNKAFVAGMLATFGITAFIACGRGNNINTVESTEQVIETATEIELPEVKEQPTTMSEEMKAFSDTTVEAIDDALEAGINLSLNEELTEADKETYARILTQYRIVANMDDLTKLEYAELFGEMSNPTENLVEAFFEYNTSIKKHLITVTNDNMLDYSNLYNNAKDAEVLNESEQLIANINDASNSSEKLEASKAWYDYAINILTSNEGNIALSSQALDTLITHSEAYDELTRANYSNIQGAHIDDELEHYFNTAKNTCLNASNESELDVEEITIENLKSVFRISFIERLESKYEDALDERNLQLTLGNELNEFNSFNEVVDYVESNVDLSKYVKLEINYIEKQIEEKGINAPAQISKDDSGISNGNGGHISESDMIQHGVDPSSPTAKQDYEQAVVNATNQQSEESKVVTNESGQVLTGTTEDNQKGFQDGYAAGNSGKPYITPNGNASYNEGYNNGYNAGKQDYEALMNSINTTPETTYVPVDNGETTYTESEEEYQDYTAPVTNTDSNIEYNTTFEPVEGYSIEGYSNYDTETTTTFVPIEEYTETYETEPVNQASAFSVESELQALRTMRDTLLSASLEEENSKTLS